MVDASMLCQMLYAQDGAIETCLRDGLARQHSVKIPKCILHEMQ